VRPPAYNSVIPTNVGSHPRPAPIALNSTGRAFGGAAGGVRGWTALPLPLCRSEVPTARHRRQRLDVIRPIVKRGRIEVCSRRPHESVHLRVELDLVEESRISKRPEHVAEQHRTEVNDLRRAVVEVDPQTCPAKAVKRCDSMEWMTHAFSLSERLDRQRPPPPLEQSPIGLQLCLMEFRPSLNKPALLHRQRPCNEIDGIDGEDSDQVLVVRMEVRPMVGISGLGEHADDDPEEAAQFRHAAILDPRAPARQLRPDGGSVT
jgi:hypothetical protein